MQQIGNDKNDLVIAYGRDNPKTTWPFCIGFDREPALQAHVCHTYILYFMYKAISEETESSITCT